jgi:hypothetical protein
MKRHWLAAVYTLDGTGSINGETGDVIDLNPLVRSAIWH